MSVLGDDRALLRLPEGKLVRVTIELPDGRCIVTDGLFHEATITNEVGDTPGADGWERPALTGVSWFTLTLRRNTSTTHHPAVPGRVSPITASREEAS